MNVKNIKLFLPVLVILIAVAIAYVISNSKPEVKKRSHHKKPMSVEVIKLKSTPWSAKIKTQGTVEARTLTTLVSRVSGEITWVSDELKPGGFFEKGDRLIKIDPIDYQLVIKSAEALLAEAYFEHQEEKARSAQAKLNWKRLGRTGAPTNLVLRKPQLAKAKAVVDSAKAVLQRAKLDLKRTVIKAPYASRILEQYVDVGQYVTSNKELVKLFAIDRVEVRLPLSEKQREQLSLPTFYRGDSINKTKDTFPILIKATVGGKVHQWPAIFSRVEGSMNRETRQQYIVAGISNPFQKSMNGRPPLEVGQFVEAELTGRVNEGVFVIPGAALNGEGELMIVDAENKLQRRRVEILAEEGELTIVKSGVRTGERVCISYIPFAANNTVVSVAGEKPTRRAGEKKGYSHAAKSGKPS